MCRGDDMENKKSGNQKIKCDVADCTHNCIKDSTCLLDEISVCNCNFDKTKDALKDTACASYRYSEVQNNEKY